nr:MAG: capsid protein [Cressdnaviricota sp.]
MSKYRYKLFQPHAPAAELVAVQQGAYAQRGAISRYRKTAAARQVAYAAPMLNIAQRGLQLSHGEFKYVDAGNGTASCDNTGAIVLLNGMAPGSGASQHIGKEIIMKSIEFKAQGQNNYATSGTARMLLVYDRQSNGATPAITDVLIAATVQALRNLDNRKRFKILMDYKCSMTGNAGGVFSANHTFYRRLRHPVEFNAGVAGTVADIISGAVFLITLGTQVNGSAITFGETTRIRYTDV